MGYKKTFEEIFTLNPRIYYDQFDTDLCIEALPEGVTLPVDVNGDGVYDKFNTYRDGIIGNLAVSEKVVGTEIPFDYKPFDGNILTLGFEYRLINQTNVRYTANVNPSTLEPLDSPQNFSETLPWIKETTRRIGSVYLQDTWDIVDTLNLTLGVRHDQYSDFGGTTNPRAGVTWEFMKNTSLKLMYGEAFRPPTFVEMFTSHQITVLGNDDLKPEKVRTFEAGLSYAVNSHIKSSVNYFNNNVKDLIVLKTLESAENVSQYENFGKAHIQGIEMETKVDLSKGNYLFMNYTF